VKRASDRDLDALAASVGVERVPGEGDDSLRARATAALYSRPAPPPIVASPWSRVVLAAALVLSRVWGARGPVFGARLPFDVLLAIAFGVGLTAAFVWLFESFSAVL